LALSIVVFFLLSLGSPSVSAWGSQTAPLCDSPTAGRYDDYHVWYGYQAKTRGGYYASMWWPIFGGLQYLETSTFEAGLSNLSSDDGQPPMPYPLFWWDTQTFPPYNATIQTVYIVALVNGGGGRYCQLGYSIDNRDSWTWQGSSTYTSSTWVGLMWNITSARSPWEPWFMQSGAFWAGIRSYDSVPWPLEIDYIGISYNWTLPEGPPEEPPEEPPGPDFGDLGMSGVIGLIGVLGMIATPAFAIWWQREHDNKIMAIIIFLMLGAVSFGLFLAGNS